ncbi:ABC-type nitrate/sulfonate/bicarbonate transport system, substrate-binding protein [Anaerocolumna jejuensis DSM 15929]|uniref:ABC-type nitrate/sulfonate/bicarbonate transport system, substrate-binding protein n=1 Tax=Anaerocolumna jejuensis DSM 15929 TaxID=1121322 RepID=A0A1M6QX12_9FIRM|nr:ABC transporter substrate-binding protein [Anaerocolumna jejuensis]SHK24771.1 ABC-type nitrate/sulfonate/bicarbonate transport system, substrate-binding protein [Anaerocolumna jejuensis DSM 15929]
MKKKAIAIILCLVLAVGGLTACGNGSKETAENDSKDKGGSLEKVRIVLDWTPNTNHTGLYVAKDLGYFKDEGLDVEIMQPPEGSTTSLIGAGGAEFGISFQDTLAPAFATDDPMPVTAVAAIIQHNTSGIVSLKKLGIDSPKKMEGHSYATWNSPIELAIIKKIVEDDGGDFSKIKLIPNTVTNVVTALKTNIDTVWIYYAWDGIATKVAGLDTNYLNFADYGKELDYYSPVIIANNSFLKKNPDTAKKFLNAVKKGYEYAIAEPDKAADILVKAVPELDPKMVKESQKWLADQYKAEVTRWGYIDQDRWDSFYKWLYDNKLIEKEIPSGTGFSNDYLAE